MLKKCNENCILTANNLVLISSIIAITISKDMSIDDINLLATLLQAIGQNLSVIATSKEICENNSIDNIDSITST